MKFNEIQLIPALQEAVMHLGYKEATPIQAKAIPVLLDGKDVLGCAKTGTGKTAAFALPILQKLYLRDEEDKYPRTIRALILAPTRELAIQIDETFKAFNSYVNLKSTAIFGGVRQGQQVLAIERGIDVLVATPGRLWDLHEQGILDLSHVEYFILDEADRMLDMGFIRDIYKIMKIIPKQRQTMLFSATLPKKIQHLVKEILNDPTRIMVSQGHAVVDNIKQSLYYVDKLNKAKLLIKLLEDPQIYQAIVFVRTKRNADTLGKKLNKFNITTEVIHGSKSQNARNRALQNFKDNKARILVATDIAARGIDIDDLGYVINFDLPEQAENYVHRIGRTARAGSSGEAITFCSYAEISLLKDVEKFTKRHLEVVDNPYYPIVEMSAPSKKEKTTKKVKQSSKTKSTKKEKTNKSKPIKKEKTIKSEWTKKRKSSPRPLSHKKVTR